MSESDITSEKFAEIVRYLEEQIRWRIDLDFACHALFIRYSEELAGGLKGRDLARWASLMMEELRRALIDEMFSHSGGAGSPAVRALTRALNCIEVRHGKRS
ncbi:MAG: hypothetical protein LPL29_13370 [Alphaproteobacteria bacterium]|nr:hypothetical protein [Alphaproteobacteria bacterium]